QVAPGQNFNQLNARPYEIIDTTSPKIGVINIMGPDLCDELKTQAQFVKNDRLELSKALNAFADAGVEVGILLHHEYSKLDPDEFPLGIKRNNEIEKRRKKLALADVKFCADERKKNPKIPPIQLAVILN